jgi:hypothetical protein
MPPAVWVPAAAGLGGAIFQSHGQSQANRAQRQATNQAMQFEREKQAEETRRYNQRYEFEMSRARMRDQIARQMLAKHGIEIPGGAGPAASGKTGGYTGTGPSVPTAGGGGGGGMEGFRASLLALSPGATGATVEGPPAGPVAGALGGFGNASGAPPVAPAGGMVTSGQAGMPAPSMAGLTNWSDELWRSR